MSETIINRETLNGTKWEIVFDGFIAALYMNGHFSGYTFRSPQEGRRSGLQLLLRSWFQRLLRRLKQLTYNP